MVNALHHSKAASWSFADILFPNCSKTLQLLHRTASISPWLTTDSNPGNHLFWKHSLTFQNISGNIDLRPLKSPWLKGADTKRRCCYSLDTFVKRWAALIARKHRQVSPYCSQTAACWSHRHFMVLSLRPLVSFQTWEAALATSRRFWKHRWVHHNRWCLKTLAPERALIMKSQKNSQRSLSQIWSSSWFIEIYSINLGM